MTTETQYDEFETQEIIDAVLEGEQINPQSITVLYKDGTTETYVNVKIKKWDYPKGFYSIVAKDQATGVFALHRIAISEIRKVTIVY